MGEASSVEVVTAHNMKRLISIALILLALSAGVGGTVPAAYATAGDTNISNGNTNNSASTGNSLSNAAASDPSAAIAADKPAQGTPTTANTGEQMDSTLARVMNWIVSLFAWLLGVAAITLDNAVYYTVVTMGDYVGKLSAIGVTWRILRDIGNIMFIFGFLAVGITTILNIDWYGIRKMLPMLLVGAIFLNFSLFFAEAVVDVGNLFATQFYTQINGGNPAGQKSINLGNIMQSVKDEGISNKLMNQLGLQRIYGTALQKGNVLDSSASIPIGFMCIILFMVAAFVMFSLAFILIGRFVALVFLIIVAPVGFAGLAIPGLATRAKQWWTLLFEQTITAPILMLMLYIALAVITDANFLAFNQGGTPDWLGFVPGQGGTSNLAGFATVLLSFLIAMGLLLLVLVYAKRWSAFGGDLATKTAGKLTFGLTAAGMRSTVGWGSQRLSQGWRRTALSRAPVLGRAVSGVLDRGAKGSFDLRGTGALKAIPLGSNIATGDAQKGGFRDWEKERIKGREEYAKTLTQTFGEQKQQKIEEGRKKMMERTVKDIEDQNKSEMQTLLTQHKVDIQPFTARVDAERQALAAAQAANNAAGIAAATLSLNTALADAAQKRDEQKREQEELKSTHDRLLKVQEDEVKVRQAEVDKLKKAPQEKYAEGLNLYIDQNKGGVLRGIVNLINPQRNSKAADNIRKAAGKSKEEKDVDSLMDLLKKNSAPAAGAPGGGHP